MVWHPPQHRHQGSVHPCCYHPCQELLAAAAHGAGLPSTSHLSVFLNQKGTFSLIKHQKTDLAAICTSTSLRPEVLEGGCRAGESSPGMEWELLRKRGTSATFHAHISSPVGQSSSALLLVVLLGEECSALFMAMNSSLLFIQLSSACWLQPQPAPSHCMTPL